MYAFYSLLVYIFYTVFKKEEEEALEGACGASPDVCLPHYVQPEGSLLGDHFIQKTMHVSSTT